MVPPEQKWEERARYDLDTARAMLGSGRHLYVLFCGQQAIEKAIKAVIVRKTGEFPPRVHNLLRLAEVAELALTSEHKQFLGDLSAYYIQTRYPEEMASLEETISAELAEETLRKTREVAEWLFSMLK